MANVVPVLPQIDIDVKMPCVSIILPTYNRARFLPKAIESILTQEFTDWELVIVDDGSTDETAELLPRLTAEIAQPVRIVRQENQGAYAARNTGLDDATGKYIAFFDSDDIWLAHHLRDCVAALDANPDIDWVYGACKLVDTDTSQVLVESSFYENSRPNLFLTLPCERRGQLSVLDQNALLAAVLDCAGLYSGLQNSVIRATVYAGRRFDVTFYNEAQDQLAVVRALADGHRFAYYDNVHVIYVVHAENSSGSAKIQDTSKQRRLVEGMIRGYEGLPTEIRLSRSEKQGLRRRLARMYFWHLGYAVLWESGHATEAMTAFRRGLKCWPWNFAYWKTFALCELRRVLRWSGDK